LHGFAVLTSVGLTVALISVALGVPHPFSHSTPTAAIGSDVGLDPSHRSGPLSSPLYDYFEITFHLSGFNPLSGYLSNLNGRDAQIPTLTSDAGQPDGIFYVGNATAGCPSPTLPFYEFTFPHGNVRQVSCIVPLYSYGYAGMFDNEFYIEYGYDEALFFGAISSKATTYSIEIVNLTTGSFLMWNTTGKVSTTNQQADYIGNSTVIVFTDNNSAWAWNLGSHSAWLASGHLGVSGWSTPVEANNLYWLPQRKQFINVEAHGDKGDQVVQLNATFPGGNIELAASAIITVDSATRFNFVNGVGYNRSWDGHGALSFEAGDVAAHAVNTYVVPYDADGLITSVGETRYAQFTMNVQTNGDAFMGQRYVYTSDYVLGSYFLGTQYLFDPWNGSAERTDHAFASAPCENACLEGTYAPSQAYLLDYNATLALNSPAMYDVVYAFHNDSNPFPGNLTQLFLPPAPTAPAVHDIGTTAATLTWTQASGGGIVNNSVELYMRATCTGDAIRSSTSGAATAYSLTGLESNESYSATVTAWNMTGESPPSACVAFITLAPTVPPSATGLAVDDVGATVATLTWNQASGGGILNDTVELYLGPGCSGTPKVFSAGPVTFYNLTGLKPATSYSAAVTAWNATGASHLSACTGFETIGGGGPSGLWNRYFDWIVAAVLVLLALGVSLAVLYLRKRR
jgi:fibronectin type III domain protein